jgi:hypothetical protein
MISAECDRHDEDMVQCCTVIHIIERQKAEDNSAFERLETEIDRSRLCPNDSYVVNLPQT